MGVMLLVFLVRLAKLQLIDYTFYTTQSQDNRVKVLPLPPNRGLIYSRDGVILAENRATLTLEVVPERIHNLDDTVEALRGVVTITDEDVTRFKRAVRKKRRFENVPLRFNLSEQEVAHFAVDRHRFPGVDIVARPTRNYPLGEHFVHVVGYVGRIDEDELKSLDASSYSGSSHIGKSGVERAYEELLHGQVGHQQVEVNAQGRILRVLERTPPLPGKDLYLTLDVSLQAVAIEALGDQKGAVVAIDPNTGGVLAMVSVPGYDPNLFVNGIESKVYAALRDAEDRPLFNRALQGKYPPGSTVKPFVALAGLEHHVRSPDDSSWCPGWFSLPGKTHKYRCWKHGGHGQVNLRMAIAQSCDVYFYRLAQDLGIERLHDFLGRFGFGHPTGIDLPNEAGGVLPSPEWKRHARNVIWYPGETLITGIGQGFMLTTPLQLATAAATMGNHGVAMRPMVASHAEDPVTHDVAEVQSDRAEPVVKARPENWSRVVEAMRAVVHSPIGTAKAVGVGAGFEFAGKTGTSQVFGIKQNQTIDAKKLDKSLWDHGLFIAFAPVEKPMIAVAIIVEHGGSGSGAAAPIARKLFDHYLAAGTAPPVEAKSGG